MSSVSRGLQSTVLWSMAALALALALVGMLRMAPDSTVVPVAERFTCDGAVALDESALHYMGVVTRIECRQGVASNDITWITLLALAVPTVLVLGTATLLIGRLLVPKQRTRLRRVAA